MRSKTILTILFKLTKTITFDLSKLKVKDIKSKRGF